MQSLWPRSARVQSSFKVFLVLLALTICAFSQTDSALLSGYVKDATGAVLPGVKVVVKSETRDIQRSATTNNEGYWVVSNLPPGLYTISVEHTGFKRYQETNKKLDPNIASQVDVTLQAGDLNETVSVVASTAAVQTETATVGKLVEGKQIEALQLNGRNPLFLALLKPGVSGGALGQFSYGLTTAGLNINGSRTQDNLITFDGAVGVRTRSNGTSIGVADLDSTQEVQILTANYNAEYGRAAGGQIRIVTRSGAKDFHGSAYEYIRNAAFNANEWGRNANTPANQPCDSEQFEKATHCRPNPFRYNQFGYNFSGPIAFGGFNKERNKLFFLWGQEWVRERRAVNRSLVVPTARMRTGDFGELLGPNQFYSAPRFIRDPQKTGACDATSQVACFPGNVIPVGRQSQSGMGLLRALPNPIPGFSGPGGVNWFAERPFTVDQRKDTLSLDYYPSENHQIRWRMQLYHFLEFNPFPFGSDPGLTPRIFDRPNQTATLAWVWTISPTLINEVLVGASRDQVFITVDNSFGLARSAYGINYPYIFPDGKEIPDKIPTTAGLGPFAILDGGPYPAQSTGPIYQVTNNMTNIRGNHTLKFGGYFERAGQNDFDQINVAGTPGGTNNQNGRFAFSNTTRADGTGTAITNAALGLFDTYAELGKRSYTPYRGHMFEWYVQDSWKASPNVRLEFGLRHTIIQPYYSLWRNMVVFDERFYDPTNVVTQNPANGFITGGNLRAQYNGVVIPGDAFTPAAQGRVPLVNDPNFGFLFRGVPKEYSEIHWGNFQPRAGIAWSFNAGKSVVRAGAGRFMTRLGVSDSVFLGGNPPLQPTVSISNGFVDNPGGQAGNAFPQQITTQDRIFKNPESWAWSATFQHEIGFNTIVDVGYVGRRGLHGQRERNINQLLPGTLQANPGINPDFLRRYKGFSIIRVTNNDANSMYHGFQASVDRRFSNGFSFGGAYTLSKVEDDGSAQRYVIPDAYDASFLWGPAEYDRRHVLVINAIWELPFFKDKSTLAGKLLGGWTISGVSQFQTGTPFTVTSGDDRAGVGPGSGPQHWAVNGDPTLPDSEKAFSTSSSTQNFWFRTRNADGTPVYSLAPLGTFFKGRVRGLVYNPGFMNHNFGIFKDFHITETHRITFRAEAFNWPNHPNWNNANTDPNATATFGRVTAKSSERQLQFALRYSF